MAIERTEPLQVRTDLDAVELNLEGWEADGDALIGPGSPVKVTRGLFRGAFGLVRRTEGWQVVIDVDDAWTQALADGSETPAPHWIADDGGRAAAGFRGKTGDCGVRAIAIALERPYREVYKALARELKAGRAGRSGSTSPRDGIPNYLMRRWLIRQGWFWHPTMLIGSGCQVHAQADELPGGRLILALSRHFAAMVEGVIHDTYDPTREGTRCVYGFWAAVDYHPWQPRRLYPRR